MLLRDWDFTRPLSRKSFSKESNRKGSLKISISSQAVSGVCNKYDNTIVNLRRTSSKKQSGKLQEGFRDMKAKLEPTDLDFEGQRTKLRKRQHHQQHLEVKNLLKEQDLVKKRVEGKSGQVGTKHAMVRRCKHQYPQNEHLRPSVPECQKEQEKILSQPINEENQQKQVSSMVKERQEQENCSLKRTEEEESSPPFHAAARGSKRSKRVAQKLIHEGPLPPPLKLPKLYVVLTREEIQEDWIKITGQKYSGKPKKSTLVQQGFGLCTSLTCPSSIRYLN